jgi:hypothetical protein
MNEVVVMQWHFNLRGKIVWSAPGREFEIADPPAEGYILKNNIGWIDSFVAVGNEQQQGSDKVGLAQFVRVDNRAVKLKLDPPDCIYAYRRRQGDEEVIVGDTGLWLDTFEFADEWRNE